jgi:hypothetical protein
LEGPPDSDVSPGFEFAVSQNLDPAASNFKPLQICFFVKIQISFQVILCVQIMAAQFALYVFRIRQLAFLSLSTISAASGFIA